MCGLLLGAVQVRAQQFGCVPNGPPFINRCLVPASTLDKVSSGTLQSVPSHAALVALPSNTVGSVLMRGYATVGDGGSGVYNITSTACLNPDGGAQVTLGGGGCAILDPSQIIPTPLVWGATGRGVVDDTSALQAAINWAARTGTTLFLGPLTYLFKPPLTIGKTLNISGSGWNQTILLETPGSSANAINIGYQTDQLHGVSLRNLQIKGQNPTGGYAISAHNAANTIIENIWLQYPFCGIDDEYSNTNTYKTIWGYTGGTNCQIFYAHANPSVGRSDQLVVHDFFVNSLFSGNDGFVWDGFVNTVDLENVILLRTKHGFWVRNTTGSTTGWPQFAEIYDLQVEGAQVAACEIDAGRSIYFTNSFCYSFYGQGDGQGNADVAAFIVNPDGAGSVTADIKFDGGQIGGSGKQAALLNAQGVYFNGTTFRGASLSSANAYPSVELQYSGYSSSDYGFTNVKFCGEFGDVTQTSYGLVRDANVGQTTIGNSNFNYCQIGEIQDNSTLLNLFVTGSIDRNRNPLPPSAGTFISNATPTASACGTSPTVTGNAYVGFVKVGSGIVTSCTITMPAGLGELAGVVIMPNRNIGNFWANILRNNSFRINSTRSMAGGYVYWRTTQGAN
jgi:hypothetical protein